MNQDINNIRKGGTIEMKEDVVRSLVSLLEEAVECKEEKPKGFMHGALSLMMDIVAIEDDKLTFTTDISALTLLAVFHAVTTIVEEGQG